MRLPLWLNKHLQRRFHLGLKFMGYLVIIATLAILAGVLILALRPDTIARSIKRQEAVYVGCRFNCKYCQKMIRQHETRYGE